MVFSWSFMAPGSDRSDEITVLLHQWREGNTEAENHLFQIVEPNLRKLAHYLMKREWRNHPLQATELVNEAYLELLAAKDRDWQNRKHFFALAATIMRRYLIDLVRRAGPGIIVPNAGDGEMAADSPEQAIALSELLDQLSRLHPEWCTVVEMKHFLGLTDEEIGRELSLPVRTVQRMWHDAREWLFDRWEVRPEPGRAR
jgi:RNA polymerase sigma factor (TIGR02999 family)